MRLLLLLTFLSFSGIAYSQSLQQPLIASKSHKTLRVDQVDLNGEQTIISLSVTNELTEGEAWFCADKNIYIQNESGDKKYKLQKSEGIPVCPQVHKFTSLGEVLRFKLYFPKIPTTIKRIDLIENCSDNCFYIKGIILEEKLNQEMKSFEHGVTLFRAGKHREALPVFLDIANNSKYTNERHYGYSMYIIPVIYHEQGDLKMAKLWYEKLKNSEISDKLYFVTTIQEIAFFAGLE